MFWRTCLCSELLIIKTEETGSVILLWNTASPRLDRPGWIWDSCFIGNTIIRMNTDTGRVELDHNLKGTNSPLLLLFFTPCCFDWVGWSMLYAFWNDRSGRRRNNVSGCKGGNHQHADRWQKRSKLICVLVLAAGAVSSTWWQWTHHNLTDGWGVNLQA